MIQDLDQRIARIYAAFGLIVETNIQKTVRMTRSENKIEVRLDGGMSPADIENAANTAIGLVAHLPDHLKRWLRSKSQSTAALDELYKTSLPIQLLADLANTEKHGGFDRNGGWSKRQPTLQNIARGLRLDPSNGAASANVRFDLAAGTVTTESGSPQVVIDAEVVGAGGAVICRLTDLLAAGLSQLEAIYAQHSGQAV